MRALVIEGGGMRAAYASGALAVLEDAGITVDAAYGTSAGGALAAWYSAGQARYALDTWRYAQDDRILSYRRWILRQGPLFDHDKLMDVVYQDEHPLDVEAVQNADHPVNVTATEVETGDGVVKDIREGNTLDWIRASGRLPLASGPPVRIEGTEYLDGGLANPVPVEQAYQDGADEVLVVLNRPKRKSEAESWVLAAVVGQQYPQLFDLVRRHAEIWNDSVQQAENPPDGVDVSILKPDDYLDLGRLARDEARIEDAIAQGQRDAQDALDGPLAAWKPANASPTSEPS